VVRFVCDPQARDRMTQQCVVQVCKDIWNAQLQATRQKEKDRYDAWIQSHRDQFHAFDPETARPFQLADGTYPQRLNDMTKHELLGEPTIPRGVRVTHDTQPLTQEEIAQRAQQEFDRWKTLQTQQFSVPAASYCQKRAGKVAKYLPKEI